MANTDSISHRSYLALAIPFTLSTLTQPLLGAVDTAVIGRLDDASYIGGVAIGSVIFNTIYWLVGFLRVSTSSFSAQSLGSSDEKDRYYAYFRPLFIALGISLLVLLLQYPIKQAALEIYDPEPNVLPHIITYFDIVVWGAPMVLTGYVNLGWFMGRKLVRETLFLQISTNLLNIILDLLFVLVLRMGVPGVAWATLIAQFFGFIIGFYIISRRLDLKKILILKADLLNRAAMKKILSVSNDLMIRTMCLLIMINMFIAKGSQLGVEILAVNAVLFQIHYLIAYLFDGMGNASSVFAGKTAQEKNRSEFEMIFKLSLVQSLTLSVILSLIVLLFGEYIVAAFTDLRNIQSLCNDYLIWLVVYPLVIGVGLVYYGSYAGAAYTAPVRNSMILALAVFAAVYFFLIPLWGNHALWLAFILFSLVRTIALMVKKNKLIRFLFEDQA